MRRLGMATGGGVLAGLVAAVITGAMFDPFDLIGNWGTFNGVAVGVLAFLVVLAKGHGWLAAAGRWLLALALAGVCWWSLFFAIGTSPLTLEGAWRWPLAVLSVAAFVATVRWAWRSARTGSHVRSPVSRP